MYTVIIIITGEIRLVKWTDLELNLFSLGAISPTFVLDAVCKGTIMLVIIFFKLTAIQIYQL